MTNMSREKKSEFNAVDGYLQRWKDFLNAAPFLIDYLNREEFLRIPDEFHGKNLDQLYKESNGKYGREITIIQKEN